MTIAAPAIVARTAEGRQGFPFLAHRTVAEVGSDGQSSLFATQDHVSSVPILHGFGTDDCWQFRFIISGAAA